MIGKDLSHCWVIGALTCCLLLAACGSSTRQTGAETASATVTRPDTQAIESMPVTRSTASVSCFKGITLLGNAAGAIDFRVRCKPRQTGEELSFFVTRAPLQGQGKPGIRDFRRRPRLSPPNVESRLYASPDRASRSGFACGMVAEF